MTYGPETTPVVAEAATSLLVVPRPGTLSPWSSKATDIAKNCGLAAVARIERGVVYGIATTEGAALTMDDRAALLPFLHDRMVEAVFTDLADAKELFAHFPLKPLTIRGCADYFNSSAPHGIKAFLVSCPASILVMQATSGEFAEACRKVEEAK